MTHTNVRLSAPTAPHQPRPLPGRGLGIAGFVLSMLGALSPIGLILSIIALVLGRRAGRTSGLAVAGTVLGAIGSVVLVVVSIAAVTTLSSQTGLCSIQELIQLACTAGP